jgi:hypothetical protein
MEEKKFKFGDIVANQFGHVLAIGQVLSEIEVLAYYQSNPSVFHKYQVADLRLLSSYKGIDLEDGKLQETVKLCLERSGLVEKKQRVKKEKEEELTEEEAELLKEYLKKQKED